LSEVETKKIFPENLPLVSTSLNQRGKSQPAGKISTSRKNNKNFKMSELLSFFLVIIITLIAIRFFIAQNSYEKILGFYFIFTNLILLILISSVTNFDSILDIIILLFLLKLMAVLFLLFNRKKI